jgi:hypothetical protein
VARTDPKLKIDRISFQLGMINCFAEMVACGVKRLALSPPLTPEDYRRLKGSSEDIVRGFGIKSYTEKSLLVTDLQSEDFTRGKWSILYFKDDGALEAYFDLKKKRKRLARDGVYDLEARRSVSKAFMKLLSYPDDVIEEKLSQERPKDPFILES